MKIIVAIIASFLLVPASNAEDKDPAANIRSLKLKNGTKVYLAPSSEATTVQIRFQIDAGSVMEEKGKAGAAHLLEHYLFKDAKLDKSMTYLEAIKENGGSGNAYVNSWETAYYATVPPKKTEWIIDTFAKVLTNKTFDDESVEETKGPVFLEIGRPGPHDYAKHVVHQAWPDFAKMEDYWFTEFGIRNETSSDAHRFETAGLTAKDVRDFYNTYYHPGNLKIFVSGKFEETKVIERLESTFGKLPAQASNGYRQDVPDIRHADYYRSTSTTGSPRIAVGTKVGKITVVDEMAGFVYFHDLAHRLMKKIRNEKNETYTASANTWTGQGYGHFTISLESSPDSYDANYATVRDLMHHEARDGNISRESFEAAMALYQSRFELTDYDSSSMMDLAEDIEQLEFRYPELEAGTTPYKVFKQLTYEQYVTSLKSLFKPDMGYTVLSEPPLLFRYEFTSLYFLSLAIWMLVMRMLLARRFDHAKLRWVRKLRYPPAYLYQIGMFVIAGLAFYLAVLSFEQFATRSFIATQRFYVSEYGRLILELGLAVFCFQLCFAIAVRKVIVCDDKLYVKSLGFVSYVVPLEKIDRIESCGILRFMFSPRLWWKVKLRFHYADFLGRKGVLVHLKDGRSWYFSLPAVAATELRAILEARPSDKGSREPTVPQGVAA